MWHSLLRKVPETITDNVLELSLSALPDWRREKALSYRFPIDRYTCAESFLLLEELLLTHYGISGPLEFEYGQFGKPVLKSLPHIHFNISHCRKAVFCAVGSSPVGVDVEEIQYDGLVAKKVFSDEELKFISNSDDPDIGFTQMWTRKESYLKLLGIGLTDDMKSLSTFSCPGIKFHTEIDPVTGIASSVASGNLK